MARSPTPNRRQTLAAISGGAVLVAAAARAEPTAMMPSPDSIDDIVARFMREFEIPGVGVAIVQPGQPAALPTYGVRPLGEGAPVDIHTQFAIASNSKAFLTASLAILVDEGKLGWEDPVTRHLPEFRMYDQCVTEMMT